MADIVPSLEQARAAYMKHPCPADPQTKMASVNIPPLGGLLLMMGHHSRSESLFYYFRIEDQVPENHLLRLISRPSSLPK
jgi:hypothetical protein